MSAATFDDLKYSVNEATSVPPAAGVVAAPVSGLIFVKVPAAEYWTGTKAVDRLTLVKSTTEDQFSWSNEMKIDDDPVSEDAPTMLLALTVGLVVYHA